MGGAAGQYRHCAERARPPLSASRRRWKGRSPLSRKRSRSGRATRFPLDWAATMNSIGNAYYRLGALTNNPDAYRAAVDAFGQALEELTRERTATGWAQAQNNLANALSSLGAIRTGHRQPLAGGGALSPGAGSLSGRREPGRLRRNPIQYRSRPARSSLARPAARRRSTQRARRRRPPTTSTPPPARPSTSRISRSSRPASTRSRPRSTSTSRRRKRRK